MLANTVSRVPGDVCADRMTRLTEVVERSALARHQARTGRVEEVLVEGPSKKDPSLQTGRTRQNKLVHFAADGLSPGDYGRVRVDSAAPHFLRGTLLSAEGAGAEEPEGAGVRAEREPADRDDDAEDEGDAQPGSDHPSGDGPHQATPTRLCPWSCSVLWSRPVL